MRIICLLLLLATTGRMEATLKEGIYRGVLYLDDKDEVTLPFLFEVKLQKKNPVIIIFNADEKITIDEITIVEDSVNFRLPFFDTEFRTRLKGDDLEGVWINHYRKDKSVIRFSATYGEARRFLYTPGHPDPLFEGKWEVTFSPGKDSSKALGIFHHNEQTDYITGTFLTETGDYRYLDGMKHGNKISLSAFDGSHAFLFEGELNDGRLNGMFYSGVHHQEPWIALRNEDFALRDPDNITTLRPIEGSVNFTFKDLHDKKISLTDKKFSGKPVIVQLMGTWCPNCMDESRYLTELYNKYHGKGLEVIALAFEKTTDPLRSHAQVSRYVKRMNIPYTVLLSGVTGKSAASEALPFFNNISAFPTTLFLDRQHRIVRIHTGFNGPATGSAHQQFKKSTQELIIQLIK
jgi:thiol-disulfide isomerase/thioredoxin